MSRKILHIGPAKHGIAAYDLQIDAIYRQQGYEVEPVLVGPNDDVKGLAEQLASRSDALYHLEIGSGGSNLFQLSRDLLARNGEIQLITIHDPGVVVWHPVAVPGTGSSLMPVRLVAKVCRKLISRAVGRSVIDRHLSDSRIHKVYLRPDLAEGERSYYLPQPTYHIEQPKAPGEGVGQPRVGFGGFWGLGKGMETLLEAVRLAKQAGDPGFKLVLGGGGADADDAYVKGLRRQAAEIDPDVELPGFVADDSLDGFLQGLSVLVLPYWPELPNGTSAMVMRAAELAVPVIASDTPSLSGQLGPQGALYVPAKDPEALRAAIARLVSDMDAARAVARQTQQKIFSEHNWKVVGQKLDEIVKAMEGSK
jgi:glycosyltransferase involved in cell wall biosynthesis